MIKGIGAADGIGIGPIAVWKEQTIEVSRISQKGVQAEKERLQKASEKFVEDTTEKAMTLSKAAGEEQGDILRGHLLLWQDPFLQGEVESLLTAGYTAEAAVKEACEKVAVLFEETTDERLKLRGSDLRDIAGQFVRLLRAAEEGAFVPPRGAVIVAKDLTPSMTASFSGDTVAGIVTEKGGRTAHSAILARALGIPAVVRASGALQWAKEGETAIVDGTKGEVFFSPDTETMELYQRKKQRQREQKEKLDYFKNRPTETADGVRHRLYCNIGTPSDMEIKETTYAEGVGLFRTEFLFMGQSTLPSEEEQYVAYTKVLRAAEKQPVKIRLLDVGGDKEIPSLGLTKEENPFLGHRAIRLLLQKKEVLLPQLRAILRAAVQGDARITLPLITKIEEIDALKAALEEAAGELAAKGIPHKRDLPLGVMMETPAACTMAKEMARKVDFFSIGTNDLTQYIMAADRGNEKVQGLCSALEPSVLRGVFSIISAARGAGIPVGMCGEAAAERKLIPVWLGMGLEEFSVSPALLLSTRKEIAEWSLSDAKKLSDALLQCETRAQVEKILAARGMDH